MKRNKYSSPVGDVELYVPNLNGIEDVIHEVVTDDCYHLAQLKRDGVEVKYALDVGAHIGTFAVMVKKLWPRAITSCFEPDVDLAKACAFNAPWVNLVTAAVRYDGRNKLYVAEHRAGNCMYDPTVNFDDDIPNSYTPRTVATTRLEPYITSQVDLLKLDCEGSEFDILSSLDRKCIPFVKRIVGEYHHISGFRFVEQILNLRFPHLRAELWGRDPQQTIGMFCAIETK